ncbi:MAG: hypothetical protein FWF18_00005, partial [Dehalococcoidia bacterium]|nr:hypothetical protein [Dehalococcoidia bacterium]
MKKLIRITLSLCLLPVLLAGCVHAPTNDTLTSEKPVVSNSATTTVTEPEPVLHDGDEDMFPDGVALIPEYPTYPVDVAGINVVWRNDADREINFGAGSSLQKKVGDGWEGVEPVRDIFTFLIPFVLAPHSQKELWYGINFYYG